MRLRDYYDVDNKVLNSHDYKHNLTLLGFFENDPIEDIIISYMQSTSVKYGYHSHLNWLVSHMTGYLSMKYFRFLLSASSKQVSLNDELQLNGRIFAFQFPQSEFQEFQMFWDNEGVHNELSPKVVCPYPSIKRRGKKLMKSRIIQ